MTVLGGIVLGYGTASAVGAFDQIELERELDVEIADDANGLLVIEENPKHDRSIVADPGEDGRITIGLRDEEQLTGGSVMDFHYALRMVNNGLENLSVEIIGVTETGTSESVIGYLDDDPNNHPFEIGAGEMREVGLRFDLTDESEFESVDTIRFSATTE